MLGYFLKLCLTAWAFYVLLLVGMHAIGKTAPENGDLAFFSQEASGSRYWRFDLYTAVSYYDDYSSRFLITGLENSYNKPLEHIIAIEYNETENSIYEVDLGSRELRPLGSYPHSNYYFVLAGDFLFPVDYSSGNSDWTRIHLPSGQSDFFIADTRLESPDISPDNRWLAGRSGDGLLFINTLDASLYHLPDYCCVRWSPDSQWYMVTPRGNPGLISVFSADGSPHPLLPERFQALSASWESDSLSILFENQGHLAAISLSTGNISESPTGAAHFWLPCLSPNQRYVIVWDELYLSLINLESSQEIWRINQAFGLLPECFWSANSRYLSLHLATGPSNHFGAYSSERQRFIFIDTLTRNHWELYPETLPDRPLYIHIPPDEGAS